jgi:RHS repeat-associated protein
MRLSLTILFLLTLTHCFGQSLRSVDKKLADVYENVPERYTSNQKEARMELFERLLMKYTRQLPKTISYPFKNLSETSAVYISTSDDGNLRIYSYDRHRRRSMPWFNNVYQYGFNGKENDNEVKGTGNQLDFGARIYDPRIGRWLSTDPLQQKYPDFTPYNFVANNPIYLVDPDGKVIRIHYMEGGKNKYYTYKPGIKPSTNNTFVQQVHEAVSSAMKSDGSRTLQKISDSKRVVTINQIFNDDDKTDYNRHTFNGNKYDDVYINWDAKSALRTTTGGGMTPANGLLHEGVHALRMINADTKAKVDAMQKDLLPNGTPYDNNEEQRVIQQVEIPYTIQSNLNAPLNINSTPQIEGIRHDHSGTPYKAKGVNSITPTDGSKQRGQSEPLKEPTAAADHTSVAKPLHP